MNDDLIELTSQFSPSATWAYHMEGEYSLRTESQALPESGACDYGTLSTYGVRSTNNKICFTQNFILVRWYLILYNMTLQ